MNGFDLSGYFRTVEEDAARDMHDSTAFDNTNGARTFLPGLHERSLSAEGFFAYDGVTDAFSIDKFLHDAFGASVERLLTVGLQGAVDLGDLAIMMNTKQSAFNVQETVGDIIMTTFEAKATKDATQSAYARGIWLMSQVVTAAVDGATYDSVTGGIGYFAHVHNTNADGTATVKIQHSTNGTVWVDLIDFGAVAALAAEQAVAISGTVNRYLRAIVTAIGGTTAKVSAAIKTPYTG